jgi:hypothetical protein
MTTEEDSRGRRSGRRCALGCESWPDESDYARCPQCGEPTSRYSDLYPLSSEEARSKKLHIEFERFYEARCERLGTPTS